MPLIDYHPWPMARVLYVQSDLVCGVDPERTTNPDALALIRRFLKYSLSDTKLLAGGIRLTPTDLITGQRYCDSKPPL